MKLSISRAPRRIGLLSVLALSLSLSMSFAQASQLTYTPNDPSFGGNPLNGSYLMSIANQEAQENAPNPLDSLDLTNLSTNLDNLGKAINTLNTNLCSQTPSSCPSTSSNVNLGGTLQ
ncbi:MAG TPA: curli assembly protein CsgF [Castellaniella sp.]|uniref:curli assembly protein CsgF n=1 Tax=Castellaniella sp. TaxID=1955812 RepID=UPI002F211FBC